MTWSAHHLHLSHLKLVSGISNWRGRERLHLTSLKLDFVEHVLCLEEVVHHDLFLVFLYLWLVKSFFTQILAHDWVELRNDGWTI